MKNLAKENRNVNELFATLNAATADDESCFGNANQREAKQHTILQYSYRRIVRCYSIKWKRSKTDTYMFILLYYPAIQKKRTEPYATFA